MRFGEWNKHVILWALLAGGAAACPAAQAATQLNTAPAGNSGSVNAPRIPRTPDADSASEADPLEPLNRGIYQFNYVFDGVLLKPMTLIYQGVVPEQGQVMVSHFLENIYTPVVFVNSVLQGDPKNTFRTLCRFVINTTLGIGGLFDVASDMGIRNRPADFGETLAFWGAGPGPYIELPIAGPSDLRDAFGRLGDAFMTPTNYAKNAVWISVWAATAIDERSKNMELLDGIYSSSLDPYATLRSAYIQKRASDIRRGKIARDKAWTFCTERHPQ